MTRWFIADVDFSSHAIRQWNENVMSSSDVVYCLGDFDQSLPLRGTVVNIKGADAQDEEKGYGRGVEGVAIRMGSTPVFMAHDPYIHMFGGIVLHGSTKRETGHPYWICISAELHDGIPISEKTILKMVHERLNPKFWPDPVTA